MDPRAGLDGRKISSPSGFDPGLDLHIKVKCSGYRPGVAQRVGRGIALFFYDRGTRKG